MIIIIQIEQGFYILNLYPFIAFFLFILLLLFLLIHIN